MPTDSPHLLVTGASGQLGRLVIDDLLEKSPKIHLSAIVRSAKAGDELSAKGVTVHLADYDTPATLDAAFAGVDRLLFVSSSDLARRAGQHSNVIAAAKNAHVKFVAYTSVLHADSSPLGLAEDHRQTEAALRDSGIPFAVLRNGWYTENYAASIPSALMHGVFLGCAGEGRIASAARADYAAAAAAVLASHGDHAGQVYELAGDQAYTLQEFAAEITRHSGKTIPYNNLPEAEFKAILVGAGLPEGLATLLADSDAGAAKGALDDTSHHLSKLIGRPTTPMTTTVAAAVKA